MEVDILRHNEFRREGEKGRRLWRDWGSRGKEVDMAGGIGFGGKIPAHGRRMNSEFGMRDPIKKTTGEDRDRTTHDRPFIRPGARDATVTLLGDDQAVDGQAWGQMAKNRNRRQIDGLYMPLRCS